MKTFTYQSDREHPDIAPTRAEFVPPGAFCFPLRRFDDSDQEGIPAMTDELLMRLAPTSHHVKKASPAQQISIDREGFVPFLVVARNRDLPWPDPGVHIPEIGRVVTSQGEDEFLVPSQRLVTTFEQ